MFDSELPMPEGYGAHNEIDPRERPMSVLAVIIPVYGQIELTRSLLRDLGSDIRQRTVAVYIVDNQGDFSSTRQSGVNLLRPLTNLGWAGGCNFGLQQASRGDYEAYILVNNDVVLSPAFIAGMREALRLSGAGLLGPTYDHNWDHQRGPYSGPARGYSPIADEFEVPFIDGTCMLVSRNAFDVVGMLDDKTWPLHGWGCDKDYALRSRSAGFRVMVTRRAYLNHIGRSTAATLPGYSEADAERENDEGMSVKWGAGWRDHLFKGFEHLSRAGRVQRHLSGPDIDPLGSMPDSLPTA
jgi:GT2 family glycosyltransferase